MQRNWIGRSEGAHVDFEVDGPATSRVTVFTTRPDTLFGATFFVVAADAKLAGELVTDEQRAAFEAYLAEVRKASDIDRMSTDRPKTGVFLGAHAVNPVNGERIPVWAADYVLADYGTGAIMAVPGQDQRDWDFAKASTCRSSARCSLPRAWRATPSPAAAPAINSANDAISLDGLADRRGQARDHRLAGGAGRRQRRGQLPAARLAAVAGSGSGAARSRSCTARRAARSPSPTTSCPSCCRTCGRRPEAEGHLAAGGRRGLGQRRLPVVRGPAKRDTDTMDTFVDSSLVLPALLLAARRHPGRSTSRRCASGCPPSSTSAVSSTRSCTCCTAGSSPRSCTTWAWSTSSSRSPRC